MSRRLPLGVLAFAAVAALAGLRTGTAVEPKAPEKVVTGELVELACYLTQGARGVAHRGCAQAGLTRGATAAVLTEEGQLYILLQDPRAAKPVDLVPLAAQRVEARGVGYNKGGITALVLGSITALPEAGRQTAP